MRMRLAALAALLLPLSAAAFQPELAGLAALPQALLPAAEVQAEIGHHKEQPLRYAVGHALALDQRNGAWDEASPGVARWRLRIASEGARSLSLHLQGLRLPPATELWLYGADGRDVQGPFSASNVRAGELWLPIVRASEAVLELRLPAAAQSALRLQVAEAFHGYRSFQEAGAPPKAAIGDDAGSCNINVACSAGNSWRNEIRATVLLTRPVVGGQVLCSGTLMNNALLDNRALVLTANHCGITASNVSSVRAYFNVQSASCNGTDDGRVDQNMAGESFLAGTSSLPDNDVDTDFTLITLAGTVPSTFNALYAGWDARSSATPTSGVAIHHPQGDEKKISVYSSSASKVEDVAIGSIGDSFTVDAWQVRWAQGTTETGSSGSALWNQNHQVVGMLSGGGASCEDPDQPDFFARLERAWTANSASNGQLKAHLDPTNSGSLTLNSKDAGSSGTLPDNSSGGGGAFGGLLLLLPALRRRRRAP
ncbi:MAG: serine protease [Stagnimonas sp.]|nr:serine protease [Stagnimonas sp.]